jgi:hypothetical protein
MPEKGFTWWGGGGDKIGEKAENRGRPEKDGYRQTKKKERGNNQRTTKIHSEQKKEEEETEESVQFDKQPHVFITIAFVSNKYQKQSFPGKKTKKHEDK